MKLLLLVLILASCGTSDNSGGQGNSPVSNSNGPVSKPSESETAQSKDALYIATELELPECTDKNSKQLVYVEDSRVFKHCSKGEWKVAEILMKDGKNGKDGAAGKDGSNGKDGAAGKDGTNGKVVNGNMWYDPVTKKYWIVPSSATCVVSSCGVTSLSLCSGDYRLPYQDELSAALARGLKSSADSLSAPKEAWVLQYSASDSGTFQTLGSGQIVGERNARDNTVNAERSDSTAGQYCIQK